jgi:transposase
MYSSKYQWQRIRRRVLEAGETKRAVARDENMSRNTLKKILATKQPLPFKRRKKSSSQSDQKSANGSPKGRMTAPRIKQSWMQWLYNVKRGMDLNSPPQDSEVNRYLLKLSASPTQHRPKFLTILAHLSGFSKRSISEHLGLSRNTVRRYINAYQTGNFESILKQKERKLLHQDESTKKIVFELLHEPPSLSGFNRTTWRLMDLKEAINKRGIKIGSQTIRKTIKESGFRWKSAKIVLTSTDPKYRDKLEVIQDILTNLRSDDSFFSIDEFGPFAIKMKAGRKLVYGDEQPIVPQWQKSKGCLILTAALELSRNQVTHFYSKKKNTTEMIRMAKLLIEEYANSKRIYMSWDAASWHISKKLLEFVEEHNLNEPSKPQLILAPLPASAQFLNVIESVFSGMARAIIHNSDYASVEEAQRAIDRYFAERNDYFTLHPKRAGKKIWGSERTETKFTKSNNCKDPLYVR